MAPNKFGIDTILAHVKQNTLLEPNRYEIQIGGAFSIGKSVMFNCHRCAIPSQSLGSFEHTNIGPVRKLPNMEVYDELSTSFYLSEHMEEIVIMHNWMKKVAGTTKYRYAYYNDIVADMQITIYNRREEKLAVVKVYEAYPIGITEVELSYAGVTPAEVSINWAYHTFNIVQDFNIGA